MQLSIRIVVLTEDGRTMSDNVAQLRAFAPVADKTLPDGSIKPGHDGSIGYNVAGQITVEGKTYQASMTLTEHLSGHRADAEAVALRGALAGVKAERAVKANPTGALAAAREANRVLEARLAALEAGTPVQAQSAARKA